MNDEMWNPRRYTEPSHNYVERQFHRVVRERDTYRALFWLWVAAAVMGWTAFIALAFKTGILHV